MLTLRIVFDLFKIIQLIYSHNLTFEIYNMLALVQIKSNRVLSPCLGPGDTKYPQNRASAFSSVHVHVLVSTRYLCTSVQQTVSRFISFVEKPLLAYDIEAGARFGTTKNETRGMSSPSIANLSWLYGKNMFNTIIPAFGALFAEHATAPPSFLDLLCCVVVS